MNEKDRKADESLKNLEGAEVTELDDESLEDVAGGNTNCNNTSCCGGESGKEFEGAL